MSLFAPPQTIETEVFAELPGKYRRRDPPAERIAAGKGALPGGCFLEAPSFDRANNLYLTDIPYGRIFSVSPEARWELVAEYDGEPNGLKIHKDGRIFVTDHKRGVMLLDAKSGRIAPLLERYHTEGFKGVNDLVFAENGDLYFTDQGQSGLQDPSGCVYRYTAGGRLECIADNIPSPNGLVLNRKEDVLYVAVTRANAVWRLPLLPDGTVSRMGVFIHLSGGRGPDGIAIDEADGLAVAHPEMGAVWIFNARGEPLYRVQSCRSEMVTNLAYGGADRRTLYIVDSLGGFVLTARVATAGRMMYSHL